MKNKGTETKGTETKGTKTNGPLKNDMIAHMQGIFETQIKKAIIDAGVGDFTIRPSHRASKEVLDNTLIWLDNFIKNEVKHFNTTFALCPSDQWNNYKILGLTDLPEILLLKEAKESLIKKWKARPSTIRRTYYAG